MAQRVGSVVTLVRYGEKVSEPIVEEGQADASAVLKSNDPAKVVSILKENGFDVWEADEAYHANC